MARGHRRGFHRCNQRRRGPLLEAFVWADQRDRVVRLCRAIEIARRRPPQLVRGGLFNCLEAVAGRAPQNAMLVIFHTAALAYLDLERREEFVKQASGLEAVWLSNEGPGVTPGVTHAMPGGPSSRAAHFVLAADARPVALWDPHGSWIEWLKS